VRRQSRSELIGSELEQGDDVTGRDERIGDRRAVGERHGGDRAVVELGDQRRAGRRARGVEGGEGLELLVVMRGCDANDDVGHGTSMS
jgi:hypothetical protein